jgi:hypothetical protein
MKRGSLFHLVAGVALLCVAMYLAWSGALGSAAFVALGADIAFTHTVTKHKD